MKIFRAIGLILLLIGLKIIVPPIFQTGEETVLVFLDMVKSIFVIGTDMVQIIPASVGGLLQ